MNKYKTWLKLKSIYWYVFILSGGLACFPSVTPRLAFSGLQTSDCTSIHDAGFVARPNHPLAQAAAYCGVTVLAHRGKRRAVCSSFAFCFPSLSLAHISYSAAAVAYIFFTHSFANSLYIFPNTHIHTHFISFLASFVIIAAYALFSVSAPNTPQENSDQGKAWPR